MGFAAPIAAKPSALTSISAKVIHKMTCPLPSYNHFKLVQECKSQTHSPVKQCSHPQRTCIRDKQSDKQV